MAAPGARGMYVEVELASTSRTSSDIIGGQNEADKVEYAEINHDPDAVPLLPSRPSRPASGAPAGSATTPAPPPRPTASKPAAAAAGGDGAAAAASTVQTSAAPGRRLFQLYSGCQAKIIGRELVPTDPAAGWSADVDALPADGGGGSSGSRKKQTRRSHFILYTIKITSRFQPEKYDAWEIKRRYSDFHQLHRDLLKATDNAKVLHLAPKRFVKNNLAEEFVNKRQSMLNLYLDALLGVGVLVKHPLTLKFLDA